MSTDFKNIFNQFLLSVHILSTPDVDNFVCRFWELKRWFFYNKPQFAPSRYPNQQWMQVTWLIFIHSWRIPILCTSLFGIILTAEPESAIKRIERGWFLNSAAHILYKIIVYRRERISQASNLQNLQPKKVEFCRNIIYIIWLL